MTLNVISPGLQSNYLSELEQDEDTLSTASHEYDAAKARLELSMIRYTALRDFVTNQLGKSPYARGVEWPRGADDDYQRQRGGFRFTGMRVGDAILQLLEEAADTARVWRSLEQIIEGLSQGGLGFPEPVQARAVNAALLKTSGVTRGEHNQTGAVAYRFDDASEDGQEAKQGEEGSIDPDDLPFE